MKYVGGSRPSPAEEKVPDSRPTRDDVKLVSPYHHATVIDTFQHIRIRKKCNFTFELRSGKPVTDYGKDNTIIRAQRLKLPRRLQDSSGHATLGRSRTVRPLLARSPTSLLSMNLGMGPAR